MIEKSRVEKSGVEKFVVEMSWVENVKVEKSVVEKFLLALGLNCPGYKFGVEKSGVEKPGVEMSCNLSEYLGYITLYYLLLTLKKYFYKYVVVCTFQSCNSMLSFLYNFIFFLCHNPSNSTKLT